VCSASLYVMVQQFCLAGGAGIGARLSPPFVVYCFPRRFSDDVREVGPVEGTSMETIAASLTAEAITKEADVVRM